MNAGHSDKIYPKTVHKILYLDRDFTESEKIHIIEAALEWMRSTNHLVEYDIKVLPCKNIIPNESIIIAKFSEDNPAIISMDILSRDTILGYYNDYGFIPYIALVSSRLNHKKYHTSVILHELGHSLGLNHNKDSDGENTLMYPSVDKGSNHITQIDLINFCLLYKCDPSKFK